MTQVARSASLDNVLLDFDLLNAYSMRAFALVNHNLSRSATWRIQLGSAPGGADIYDSGDQLVWRISFDTGVVEWGDANWWEGRYDDESVGHPFAAIFMAPADVAARYVRISLMDPFNPSGYVQLGRVFAGGGVSPAYNMSYGMSDAWESLTQVETTPGGTDYFDERRAGRVTRFVLDHLGQQSEFRSFFEMQRRLGVSGEVLYLPDASDMADAQLRGFLGRMRTLSPIEYPFFSTRRAAFELKELL
jgi:hypothetical protein